jgi:hypothetical protein
MMMVMMVVVVVVVVMPAMMMVVMMADLDRDLSQSGPLGPLSSLGLSQPRIIRLQ